MIDIVDRLNEARNISVLINTGIETVKAMESGRRFSLAGFTHNSLDDFIDCCLVPEHALDASLNYYLDIDSYGHDKCPVCGERNNSTGYAFNGGFVVNYHHCDKIECVEIREFYDLKYRGYRGRYWPSTGHGYGNLSEDFGINCTKVRNSILKNGKINCDWIDPMLITILKIKAQSR